MGANEQNVMDDIFNDMNNVPNGSMFDDDQPKQHKKYKKRNDSRSLMDDDIVRENRKKSIYLDDNYIDADKMAEDMKKTKGSLSPLNNAMFKHNVNNSVLNDQMMLDDIVNDINNNGYDHNKNNMNSDDNNVNKPVHNDSIDDINNAYLADDHVDVDQIE